MLAVGASFTACRSSVNVSVSVSVPPVPVAPPSLETTVRVTSVVEFATGL